MTISKSISLLLLLLASYVYQSVCLLTSQGRSGREGEQGREEEGGLLGRHVTNDVPFIYLITPELDGGVVRVVLQEDRGGSHTSRTEDGGTAASMIGLRDVTDHAWRRSSCTRFRFSTAFTGCRANPLSKMAARDCRLPSHGDCPGRLQAARAWAASAATTVCHGLTE